MTASSLALVRFTISLSAPPGGLFDTCLAFGVAWGSNGGQHLPRERSALGECDDLPLESSVGLLGSSVGVITHSSTLSPSNCIRSPR
jgi:hypothetical protein